MSSRVAMPITILMADDDADDRRLTQEAFEEGRLINDVRFVENGEQLLDYMLRRGAYSVCSGNHELRCTHRGIVKREHESLSFDADALFIGKRTLRAVLDGQGEP